MTKPAWPKLPQYHLTTMIGSVLGGFVLGFLLVQGSFASEDSTIKSQFSQAAQYIRAVVYTVNGLEGGAPIIQINKEQSGPVIRIRSEGDNALAIQAGNLRDRSILRPDLGFDLIANPIICGPGEGFIRKIDQNGKGECKKITHNDLDTNFDNTYQRRIKGPCPDNMFVRSIERDGRVMCEFPNRQFLIDLLADHFERNIGGICPEWTFMIGVEGNGASRRVKCGSLVDALGSLSCATGHAIAGFSTNGIICVPNNPAFQCPAGQSIIGYNTTSQPICAPNQLPDCPAGQVYRGGSCGPAFGTYSQCQEHQRLQGFTSGGLALCGQATGLCPQDQLLAGVQMNGTLICRGVELTPTPTPGPNPNPNPTPDPNPNPTPTPDPAMCDCADPLNGFTIQYPCDSPLMANCI
ncbi:MAG: hypothetical protein NZL83_00560 [Candidatus Absconditabacterales bacterium]|nr:hypothetical protein [Candidatus Absconditabacterales bacterium]